MQNDLQIAEYYAVKAGQQLQQCQSDIKSHVFYLRKAQNTKEWMDQAEVRENESKNSK